MKPIQVGLLGIGTVGSGTFKVLTRNQTEIRRRAGRGIEIAMVADLDTARAKSIVGEGVEVVSDARAIIANPASYNLRQLTESWCRRAGFKPDVALEVTEFATIRELISRGLGIALLPHDERTPPGIDERRLAGDGHHRDIALVWGAAVEAPATRRLSVFLREELT